MKEEHSVALRPAITQTRARRRAHSGQKVDTGLFNVLLAHGAASSAFNGGGTTSLIDIAAHLDRTRFRPLVLCPERGELPCRLEEMGIQVIFHRKSVPSKLGAFRFAFDTVMLCRTLRRNRIAIVHSNSVGGRRSSFTFAARMLGIPYVQHVRSPVTTAEMEAFGFRWASRIVTNSHAVAEPLRQDPRFRHKTVTVYNGVDLSAYDEADNRRSELPAGRDPVIGFAGQLIARKGVTTLVTAFARVRESFPNAILVIVGWAPPRSREYGDECRQLATQLGLERDVVFTGYRRDIAEWMRTFDVFVLPTRSEGFGKVIVEAMAVGCPVVATNVGGIPEIITGPEFGTLVPPDDAVATARAIEMYVRNPTLARQVGQAASRTARERFSVQGMVRAIEQVYLEVLGPCREEHPRDHSTRSRR